MFNILLVCVFLAVIALGPRCTLTDLAGGNTSQVGNPYVVGMIYNPDGSGAKNARVQFVPVNFDPHSGAFPALSVDSTITDAEGGYHFDSLPAGTYNIFGKSVTGQSFRNSFSVPENTPVTVPNDTLKAPGSLNGVVRLQPGDDSRTVFIIVMGTTMLAAPDDAIGNFALTGMAGGVYRMRILSTLDAYQPKDTVFTIMAGVNAILNDTIYLTYTGIPTPAGLKAAYDTLMQIVTLSWNKPTAGKLVSGYNIYRKHQDSSTILLKGNWLDTVYKDSTGLQDITYQYQVAAVDSLGTEGTKSSSVSVTISSVLSLQATLLKGQGTENGYFSSMKSFTRDASGNFFCIDADANFARIQKFDSAGNFILQWCSFGDGDGQFRNPLDIACDSSGNIYVADNTLSRVQVFSNQGVLLSKWGSSGTGPGQFSYLDWIAISGDFAYTGEGNGFRIQKFDLSGMYLLAINVNGGVSGLLPVDSIVFVTVNDQFILKYSSTGTFIDTVYKAGKMKTGTGEFYISGISCAAGSDTIFVINRTESSLIAIDLAGKVFYTNQVADPKTTIERVVSVTNSIYVGTSEGYIFKYTKH